MKLQNPGGSHCREKCADCGTHFKLKTSQYAQTKNTSPLESRIPRNAPVAPTLSMPRFLHCDALQAALIIQRNYIPDQTKRVLLSYNENWGYSQGEISNRTVSLQLRIHVFLKNRKGQIVNKGFSLYRKFKKKCTEKRKIKAVKVVWWNTLNVCAAQWQHPPKQKLTHIFTLSF